MAELAPDWDSFDSVECAIRIFRAHEQFDAAMLRSAQAIIDGFRSQPLVNLIMNDRGRFLFLTAALGLHADPDGNGNRLLPGRLAAFCEQHQICSRGRAKAMMAVLRWAGCLESGPTLSDGRTRPLAPTELMLDMTRRRWRAQLDVIAPIEGATQPAARALGRDPEFVCCFAKVFIRMFERGFRVLDHAAALTELSERNAGLPIVIELYLSERRAAEPPSIAGLARRFGVSRGHVRQTIGVAEAQGLFSRDARAGTLRIEPTLDEAMASFFAATLLLFSDVAIQLAGECGTA